MTLSWEDIIDNVYSAFSRVKNTLLFQLKTTVQTLLPSSSQENWSSFCSRTFRRKLQESLSIRKVAKYLFLAFLVTQVCAFLFTSPEDFDNYGNKIRSFGISEASWDNKQSQERFGERGIKSFKDNLEQFDLLNKDANLNNQYGKLCFFFTL